MPWRSEMGGDFAVAWKDGWGAAMSGGRQGDRMEGDGSGRAAS